VSRDDVLGAVGDGWAVMRDALSYERVGIARYARCESLLARLSEVLDDQWDELPQAVQTRWVRALVSLRVARLLAYRAVANTAGGIDPVDASAARIVTTTCDQVVAELLLEAVGGTALDVGPEAPLAGAIDDHWRYAQAATVASGTIEVQRMLVARAVLGGRL
jgi:alkylation response protein AidB-like acyl-CoA dehydrogenase